MLAVPRGGAHPIVAAFQIRLLERVQRHRPAEAPSQAGGTAAVVVVAMGEQQVPDLLRHDAGRFDVLQQPIGRPAATGVDQRRMLAELRTRSNG